LCALEHGRRAGTREARPGLPTGHRSVGSHTLRRARRHPPGRGSLAPAREQRLVAGCRDVFVSSAK